jgi:hypothetical protein
MFEENELAKSMLGGEPIQFGQVDIMFKRKSNFVGPTESKVLIDLTKYSHRNSVKNSGYWRRNRWFFEFVRNKRLK